jgi:4-carboxymuconolactone decarboxylase
MSGEGLGNGRSLLVHLSAALAARDHQVLRSALEEAARELAPMEVEETILQSYLFLGYPVALNAFATWREVSGASSPPGAPDDWGGWGKRGEEVCRRVYGGQYEGLRRNVRALHPDMERWMVVEGYGKVLGRPGLDLATRELCIAALLSVLQAHRQLYSHLRGALNAGATSAEVEEVLNLACRYVDEDESESVWAVWGRVKARTPGSGVREKPRSTNDFGP